MTLTMKQMFRNLNKFGKISKSHRKNVHKTKNLNHKLPHNLNSFKKTNRLDQKHKKRKNIK